MDKSTIGLVCFDFILIILNIFVGFWATTLSDPKASPFIFFITYFDDLVVYKICVNKVNPENTLKVNRLLSNLVKLFSTKALTAWHAG